MSCQRACEELLRRLSLAMRLCRKHKDKLQVQTIMNARADLRAVLFSHVKLSLALTVQTVVWIKQWNEQTMSAEK